MSVVLATNSVVSRAFFRIDGKNKHQYIQCVLWVLHVKHIGICPVPDFFGYTSYVTTGTVTDVIIPLKPVAVYIPAVIINVESGSYECKLFADAADIMRVDIHLKLRKPGKHLFLNVSDLFSAGVINTEQVSPCKLTFYNERSISGFVINVVAVKPRE